MTEQLKSYKVSVDRTGPTFERRRMRLNLSERKVLLAVVDLLLVNGSLLLALQVRTDFPLGPTDLLSFSKWFLTLTTVWLACASFFDLYSLPRAAHVASAVRNSVAATLLTVFVYTLIPWLTPPLISRGLIFTFAGATVVGVGLWRLTYARVFAQPWFKLRAVIVGAGHAGCELTRELQTSAGMPNPYRGSGYELVGFIDDNPLFLGTEREHLPVLGGHDSLLREAQRQHVDEVILAITHRHAIREDLFDVLVRCAEAGYRVTSMAAFYERVLERVPVEHVGRDLDRVLQVEEAAGHRFYQIVRRFTDILLGAPLLIILAVIMPCVALANAFMSPGPLLYRQRRVGRNGTIFSILKFRSMVPDAEQNTGAVWAQRADSRVTPIGKWLRRTRVDELPQVINIIRGEMTFIGPRPERPEFVSDLAQKIPFYRARHAVRPGLTGWAQVRYDYGSSVDDARIKLEYDLYYVRHVGPWLDLRILLRTAAIVLQFKGR